MRNLATERVLDEIATERDRQRRRWGEQSWPNGTGLDGSGYEAEVARNNCDEACVRGVGTFALILQEEVAEALAESDSAALRCELMQVAAVAVAWIEAIDKRM